MVVAVNKWDAIDEYQRELVKRSLETRLAFLKFAALHLISARKRQGLAPLWDSILGIPCGELQDAHAHFDPFVVEAVRFQTPKGWCRSSSFVMPTKGGMNPPVIVVRSNSWSMSPLSFSKGGSWKGVQPVGTPLRIR